MYAICIKRNWKKKKISITLHIGLTLTVTVIETMTMENVDSLEMWWWFAIDSGIEQGCMLLHLLFLRVLDWVMRKVNVPEVERGTTTMNFEL